MIIKQQGFSLIELIVVMIMIAGLVAIVAPSTTKSLHSSKRFIEEKKLNSLIKQVSTLTFFTEKTATLSFQKNSVEIWLDEELHKKEIFEALFFDSAQLHFSSTGFVTSNPVMFSIKNTSKKQQLLIDCEESYVICKA